MTYILYIILIFIALKYLVLTAPFVPSHAIDLKNIAELVEKYKIKSLVDLGCGNGRIIGYLSKKYPDKNFKGIEIAFLLWSFCSLRFLKRKNVAISYGNIYWHDWTDNDAIFLFWMPKSLKKNIDKIKNKVKEGQYIISYAFEINGLSDKLLERVKKSEATMPIYIYRI